jgi:hypothetical protein
MVNGVTTTKPLVMDELSICAAPNGAIACMALSITLDKPFDGKRAIVEGIESGDSILMRKMHVLAENEPANIPTLGSVFISWPHAIELIKACQVAMATETHAHDIYLELKDGRKLRAVEPMIDDVFKIADQAQGTCGAFPLATE